MTIDRMIHTLVLVRLGQELGMDSRLARVIHDTIEILLAVMK
jgi:hypothetical protein